jgi:hypothetical protein
MLIVTDTCNLQKFVTMSPSHNFQLFALWHQGLNNNVGTAILILWNSYRKDTKIKIQHSHFFSVI